MPFFKDKENLIGLRRFRFQWDERLSHGGYLNVRKSGKNHLTWNRLNLGLVKRPPEWHFIVGSFGLFLNLKYDSLADDLNSTLGPDNHALLTRYRKRSTMVEICRRLVCSSRVDPTLVVTLLEDRFNDLEPVIPEEQIHVPSKWRFSFNMTFNDIHDNCQVSLQASHQKRLHLRQIRRRENCPHASPWSHQDFLDDWDQNGTHIHNAFWQSLNELPEPKFSVKNGDCVPHDCSFYG